MASINIETINGLLRMNLNIPDYQRPYKWDIQNMVDLLTDIEKAICDYEKFGNSFKYRVGTIILHNDKEQSIYQIVDGQQRIISFLLLKHYLEPSFSCPISELIFSDETTQANMHRNYRFIEEWFSLKSSEKENFILAFDRIIEVVVIIVDKLPEAFQLFDSQNTRGKALDPHDLLKAYHLREMKQYPYEMEHAVKKWEAKNTSQIRELFDLYLFPIWNWSRGTKSKSFTVKEIDTYKGVPESSLYTYARRASKSMPYFQITEPFISGNDFFEMVEHYLQLLADVKKEIQSNAKFAEIKQVFNHKNSSSGFGYSKNLFLCALLCYYDKFHNFDEMAIKKLFTWSLMIRIDMEHLGFDSINKYAVGESNSNYTNVMPIFSKISSARLHSEISSIQNKVKRNPKNRNWDWLYDILKHMNGIVEV